MAGKKKSNPKLPTLSELVDHFPDFLNALVHESDVSAALLIGSYIGSLLYGLLEARFASKSQAAFLLEVDGPLGNSFRRASAAYCIKAIVSGNELNLINQICGIRNEFAHGWKQRLTFDSEELAEKCAALEYRDEWIPTYSGGILVRKPGTPKYRSLKHRFVHVSWALLVGIISSRALAQPARIKPYHPHGNDRDGMLMETIRGTSAPTS